MNRWFCLVACAACGSSGRGSAPEPVKPVEAELVDIARLEAKRYEGVEGLWIQANAGSQALRTRAIRGLARVGGARVVERLERVIESTSRDVWIEAVRGMALAGAEGNDDVLALALSRAGSDREKAAALFSLGRQGTKDRLAAIAAALKDDSATVREAAGIALGVYGRRQIALTGEVRRALVLAARDPNRGVRYAATYALAREHEPTLDKGVVAVLVDRTADDDPESRAVAIYGLAKRKAPESISYLGHLEDSDWRVAVEAVRALTQGWTLARDREQLAAWLARSWAGMKNKQRGGPRIHVIVEALTGLRAFASEGPVREVARAIYDKGGDAEVRCRAAAILAMVAAPTEFVDCAKNQDGPWPAHERERLWLEVAADRGDAAAIAQKLGDPDPRIRGAAVTAYARASASKRAGAGAGADPTEVLIDALKDTAAPVAGAAAEALASRADAGLPPALATATLDRARSETDPELRLTLLGALAKAEIEGAEPLCRDALGDPNRTIRQAARDCIKTVTGTDPGPGEPSAAPKPPPVDVADVVGKRVTWTVNTSRGTIVIELSPDAAPWHVAVIVSLTNNNFYDGLLWHRVVPDFVIQGGDPTGSGWGGPGFTVPAEPSYLPYSRGAVGIADAGLDTGGCQWFAMHSRAPHLEARYTVVGKVTRGQQVVDSIRVGDTIQSATVRVH